MAKRKFSTERLYKLTRNTLIVISILCLIPSAIAFTKYRSLENKLNMIDSSVEYPKQYNELTFQSLDDFLKYIDPPPSQSSSYPSYRPFGSRRTNIADLFPKEQKTNEQIKKEEEISKKNDALRKKREELRDEIRKAFKLPEGFESIKHLKDYRYILKGDIANFNDMAIGFLISAISLQFIFWVMIMGSIKGSIWLFKYLFPIKEE